MKTAIALKLAVGATLLGGALSAPTFALAEDVIDDAMIARAADQKAFEKAVAARQARVSVMAARRDRHADGFADMDRRLREEALQPGGPGN